jgi:mRNA interferase MazF
VTCEIAVAAHEVWLTDFGEPLRGEQRGVRPAVVVASELHYRFPIDMTLVVPLTTKNRGLPHHVLIDSPKSGLTRPSWARTEDVRAISTQRLFGPLEVNPQHWENRCSAGSNCTRSTP